MSCIAYNSPIRPDLVDKSVESGNGLLCAPLEALLKKVFIVGYGLHHPGLGTGS